MSTLTSPPSGRSRASRSAAAAAAQALRSINNDDDASEYADSDSSASSHHDSDSDEEWRASKVTVAAAEVASLKGKKRKRKPSSTTRRRGKPAASTAPSNHAASDQEVTLAEAAARESRSRSPSHSPQQQQQQQPSRLHTALHFEPADASLLQSLQTLLQREEERTSDDDDDGSELEGEYERRRRKRLRANQALFEQLGLGGSAEFTASHTSAAAPTTVAKQQQQKQEQQEQKQQRQATAKQKKANKPQYAKRPPFIYKRAAPFEDGTITTLPLNCTHSLAFAYVDPPCLQAHIKEQYELRLDVPALPVRPKRYTKPTPLIAPKDRWQVWRRIDELEARLQVVRYNKQFDEELQQQQRQGSASDSLSPTSTSSPSSFWKGGRQVLPRTASLRARANSLVVRLKVPPHYASAASHHSSPRGSSHEHNVWVRSAADVSEGGSEDLDWLFERQSNVSVQADEDERAASYHEEEEEEERDIDEEDDDDDDDEAYESFDDQASSTGGTVVDAPQFAYEEQVARLSVQASGSPELLERQASILSSPFKGGGSFAAPALVEPPVSPSNPWSPAALSSPLPGGSQGRLDNTGASLSSQPPYTSHIAPCTLTPSSTLHSHRHSPSSVSSYHNTSFDHTSSSQQHNNHSHATLPLHAAQGSRYHSAAYPHTRPDSSSISAPDVDFSESFLADLIPSVPYSHV